MLDLLRVFADGVSSFKNIMFILLSSSLRNLRGSLLEDSAASGAALEMGWARVLGSCPATIAADPDFSCKIGFVGNGKRGEASTGGFS